MKAVSIRLQNRQMQNCCIGLYISKNVLFADKCKCSPFVQASHLRSGLSLCALQGSVWSDCLYGCCCYLLSWLQISRELKRRAASHASSSSSSARYTALTSLQGAHLVQALLISWPLLQLALQGAGVGLITLPLVCSHSLLPRRIQRGHDVSLRDKSSV